MSQAYIFERVKTCAINYVNNGYFLMNKQTQEVILVDPAWELSKFTAQLDKYHGKLVSILLTHSHFDHINLVEPLIEAYNPTIYLSKKETEYYHFQCRNLRELADFDEIPFGNDKIQCILTPGHTAGSMCYLIQDSLFTGDTIFCEGCGVCNAKGGSPYEMFHSIQRIKNILSSEIRVYPSHSYGIRPGEKLQDLYRNNIYFNIKNINHFVKFRMR